MPPPADLPGFLHGVAPILDRWGYLAVAGMIGVESFGVPAPGQTFMVAAAIYAGAGRLNIFGVAAVAFIAAVLGDNIGYWIGVRGGRRFVHRFGKYIFLTPDRLERAEGFFARRGGRIVVVARFIDGLRQFNGVIAGITAMPWRTFLLYNAIGAALWVGWWTTVAYLLGNHLFEIIEHAHRYKWWAIGIITIAVIGYVWMHWRHIKRRRARAAAAASAGVAAADDPTSGATDGPVGHGRTGTESVAPLDDAAGATVTKPTGVEHGGAARLSGAEPASPGNGKPADSSAVVGTTNGTPAGSHTGNGRPAGGAGVGGDPAAANGTRKRAGANRGVTRHSTDPTPTDSHS